MRPEERHRLVGYVRYANGARNEVRVSGLLDVDCMLAIITTGRANGQIIDTPDEPIRAVIDELLDARELYRMLDAAQAYSDAGQGQADAGS